MFILFLIAVLPLLEIAGFVIIGGKIGVGWSLLWVIGAAFAGFYILATMGGQTLQKAKKSVGADVYPFEEMFDGLCILLGASLLIFPGFISDFLALPLLIPPVRHWIFRYLKYRHESVLKDLGKNAQGFTYWYYEKEDSATLHGSAGSPPGSTTIEGEFRKIEEDKNLSSK